MAGLIGIPPAPGKEPAQNPGQSTGNDSDLIRDVDTQDFESAVIEASMTQPILVDFWAPWCGPCKTLGPLIEKAVTEAGGAVKLVKIDTDKNQEIAAQLRIQSLPTVYAFFQGRPIDGFQGALPESQIKEFIEKLIEKTGAVPTDTNPDLEGAIVKADELIEENALEQADALMNDLMAVAGDDERVLMLMAKLMLAQSKHTELQEMLDSLDPELLAKPEMKAVSATLSLSTDASDLPDINTLRAKLSNEPENMGAKFDLVRALLATAKRDEAVDHLLDMFKADRDWQDGAARMKLLELFEVYGQADPFTVKTRRRLSALMYS